MGIRGLFTFLKKYKLYEEVKIREIAEDFRRKGNENPEIAVDGSQCVWYLYANSDFLCGGQYKEFREACRTFVQQFHDCGVRLVFFFDGVPIPEKMETWCSRREEHVMKISELFSEIRSKPYVSGVGSGAKLRLLPEAIVPIATTIFRYDLSCEVHLSSNDCDTELAQYAATNKNCIGILSKDTDYLVYEGVPSLIWFDSLDRRHELKAWRFPQERLASHLGLRTKDLPTFASFVGNDIVSSEYLRSAHLQLKRRFGNNLNENVARLIREGSPGNVENMCRIAFGRDWMQGLQMVELSIQSYAFIDKKVAENEPALGHKWEAVLRYAEAKSVAAEIPGVILSVMKCHILRFAQVLEDLSLVRPNMPATGTVLSSVRARMYSVLLWECEDRPCKVVEYIPTEMGKVAGKKVSVQKVLPPGVSHPGLIALWSGVSEDNWRLFSWIVSPHLDPSALISLSPLHLVVPAASLYYLLHEADRNVLTSEEAELFAAVAVCVEGFSANELAAIHVRKLDDRAMYLSTLYVRSLLHILDVAGACGLSFLRPNDFLLDAYFDGKLFHHLFNEWQNGCNFKNKKLWNDSYEKQFKHLKKVIEGQLLTNTTRPLQ